MSRVLKNFLIGIGYDTRKLEEGEKRVMSGLQGVKSGALGISAAIVGAFGAAGASIVATARNVDQLALSTQNLRTSQNQVYNFGNAIRLMGGSADEAVDALKRFEQIQNDLRIKGQAGPVNELAMAGIDVSALYGTQTGEEFAQALAGMLPSLDEGQRSVVQESLGLSDATFRTLAMGIDGLNKALQDAQSLTGNIEQLTEGARQLRENQAEFGLIIEGVSNELAEKFMPSLIGASESVNIFLKSIRGEISGAIDYAAENATATGVIGGSAAAALIGSGASKLGLGTIGGALTRAGWVGLLVGGAAVAAHHIDKALMDNVPGYRDAALRFDDWARDVTGIERIPTPMELLFGSNSASDSIAPAQAHEEERQASADALAGALSRAPLKVDNSINLNVQLDGQAIDARIIDVTEQQAYQTLEDLQSTTER